MKYASLALLGLTLCLRAQAAEPAAAPEEPPKAEAPKAEAPKAETPKVEAPKKEAVKEEPAKPVEKAEPEKTEKPKPAAKGLSPEETLQAEWKFLSSTAQDKDGEIQDGAIENLKSFVDKRPDAPMRADALYLLATLRRKRGDEKGGLVDLLRLAYEYPESKHSMKARSDFLDGAGHKFSKRFKPAEEELVKVPKSEDKAERLASLSRKLGGSMEDSLYDASVEEIHRFQARFPDHAESDDVQWSLGQLHDKAGRPTLALVAYEGLLAVYPASEFRPRAQFAVGVLYADSLKDYKKAIDAFAEVVEKYPGTPDVLPSLQRSSQLYSEKLKQYQLAVEVDEKIVKLFPKTDGALGAFKDAAKLQRDRLKAPAEAIKTEQRLAEMFPAAAVDALREAAVIARKDLRDYKQEVEIRHGIAKNYPTAKEAVEELFSAAEVCEDDLKDTAQAASLYKEIGTSFPGSKQAKKAEGRLAKLEPAPAPAPDAAPKN